MRTIRITCALTITAALAGAAPAVLAQDVDCQIISAAGGSTADGSVFLLGQTAAGLVSNANDDVDQGVIPCWVDAGIPCPGDIDGDLDVDLTDLSIMLAAFGTCVGDPAYNPDADFDNDGCVSLSDLSVQLALFGTVCS